MKMGTVPDADYIRDAEMNGIPSPDPVECPVCGKAAKEVFIDCFSNVCGCDRCIKRIDAYEWQEEKENDSV